MPLEVATPRLKLIFFRVFQPSKKKARGGCGARDMRETCAKGEAPCLVARVQRSTPAYALLGARTEHEIRFNNTSRGS